MKLVSAMTSDKHFLTSAVKFETDVLAESKSFIKTAFRVTSLEGYFLYSLFLFYIKRLLENSPNISWLIKSSCPGQNSQLFENCKNNLNT